MKIFMAILAGMLIFFLLLLCIEYTRRRRGRVSDRIRRYADEKTAPARNQRDRDLAASVMRLVRRLSIGVKKLQRGKRRKNYDLLMQRAGLPLLGSEFVVILLLGGLVGSAFTFLLTLNGWAALLAFFAVSGGGRVYINLRVQRRRRAFTNQLGDTLSMVSNAMRAGFSFLQAMDLISREMAAPIGEEFSKVTAEMRFGANLETALESMAGRVDSRDFDLVVTAVLIQRQVGGNLAQILDTISNTINERIRMKREVLALTAQGRLSGWVLAGLPFVVAGFLSFINPDYLQPLFTEPIGRIFLVGAVVMILVGFYVIQRIVDIDV